MEIKRNLYLNRLISLRHSGMVKVITGPRRCGKSYLLFNLFKNYLLAEGVYPDHIVEVALDEEESEPLLDRHALGQYIRSRLTDNNMHYVLIDEIQEVAGFERTLNSLMRLPNTDIYVTGSNSRFLSSEIATIFRDRGEEIRVHPLSFAEFMSVQQQPVASAWDDYLTYGGMPRVLYYQNPDEKAHYLKTLFERTYLTDIMEKNELRKSTEMGMLLDTLASATGSLTNPIRLEHTFRSELGVTFDHETITRYIGYLENAFLINEAKRFDVKGKKYLTTPLKYYFEDLGLRNARLNFRQLEEPHLMENVVYNELKIRGFNVDVGVVENYRKEQDKTTLVRHEIDFVANRGSNRCYLQTALNVDDIQKRNQEIRPLLSVRDSFKKIIIIKNDIKPHTDEHGIITMGLFHFLLDEHSLEG